VADKRSKKEATKRQGEAQVEHATEADPRMESEGMIARENAERAAEEAEDQERRRP